MGKKGMQAFGGQWTEQKLAVLEKYLRAYCTALSKRSFLRVYIDAFAGTGYRELNQGEKDDVESGFAELLGSLADTEPQRFMDGSAKIALRVEPSFHRFIFIERDPRKAEQLELLKAEFPQRAAAIDVRVGDANSELRRICAAWDKRNERGVLFLDPFGMQTEWETVQAVADTGCIDTWILFPFSTNRLMARSGKIPEGWRTRLTKVFGTQEWETQFYKDTARLLFDSHHEVREKSVTMQSLGAFYQRRLEQTFPIVANNPPTLFNSKGQPLFKLFFAAANPGEGGKIAERIARHILDNM